MQKDFIWKIVVLAVVAAILFISAQVLNLFLDMLIMAAVSAYLVYPLTRRVHKYLQRSKYKFVRGYVFASIVSFLALILPFVFLILQTISVLTDPKGTQVFLDLLKYSPEISSKVKNGLDTIGLGAFSEIISGKIRELTLSLGSRVSLGVAEIASRMLIQVPIYLISTYYFIQDGPSLVKKIRSYVPEKEKFISQMIAHTDRIAHGIFMGHFLTSIIVGVITVIGFGFFSLIGVFPISNSAYLVFIGIITAVAVLLPIIGAWFIFIPIALWVLSTLPSPQGVINAIIILVFGEIFLVGIPDLYIRPNLAGKRGRVHPLIILIGFVGGPLIWGVKGFILGPLALGLAQAAIESYFASEEL